MVKVSEDKFSSHLNETTSEIADAVIVEGRVACNTESCREVTNAAYGPDALIEKVEDFCAYLEIDLSFASEADVLQKYGIGSIIALRAESISSKI